MRLLQSYVVRFGTSYVIVTFDTRESKESNFRVELLKDYKKHRKENKINMDYDDFNRQLRLVKRMLKLLNVPVICGGVEVCPGDLIIGDCNGVLVIKPKDAEWIMEKADAKIKAEQYTIQRMKETGEILPRVIRPENTEN